MANRLYFGNSPGDFFAFDFDGNPQTADNQDLDDEITGTVSGAFALGNRVGVIDQFTGTPPTRIIRFWDRDWNRTASADFNLNSNINIYQGLALTETRVLVLNTTQNRIEFYDYDGNYLSSENISLPAGTWTGMIIVGDRIIVMQYIGTTTSRIHFYTLAGVVQSSEQITIELNDGFQVFHSMGFTDDRIYAVRTTGRAYAWTYDRVRSAGDDIVGITTNANSCLTIFEQPNTAPTFAESSYAFNNASITVNSSIGTVVATDDDGDTLTYSLTGTDANRFSINASGQITIATALSYSTTYRFNIVANDGTESVSVPVTVSTGPQPNRAPTFAESSYTFDDVPIAENSAVGGVTATDLDGDTLVYSLTGADAGNFAINDSGQITVASALAFSRTYSFNVVVSDGTLTASVPVTVASVDDTLTVTLSGAANVEQNQEVTITASVVNSLGNVPADPVQYEWTASRGSFVGATDQASIRYRADFTATDPVDAVIECTVTSGDASPTVSPPLTVSTAVDVLLLDNVILNMLVSPTEDTVVDANSDIYDDQDPNSTLIAGSDDQLAADIHVWRIRWNDRVSRFILNNDGAGSIGAFFNGNTAQSVFVVFQDGEYIELDSTTYAGGGNTFVALNVADTAIQQKFRDIDADDMLLAIVADAGSLGSLEVTGTGSETIRVTVPGVSNTAPTFAESSYAFNNAAIAVDTVIGTVTATDADGDTLTYSLTGTDANNFEISSSGQITVAAALSYATTYNFNIVADDGMATASVAVTVTTGVQPNRAPTFAQNSYAFANVGIAVNSVIGTVAAMDADADTLTYSLTGTDASNFAINGNGQITVAIALAYLQMYNFTVVVSDGDLTASVPVTATARAMPSQPGELSIASVDAQNILINTDYVLRVRITGQPDEVWVRGDVRKVDYDWDAASEEVVIRLNTDQIWSDRWRIYAQKGTADPIFEDVSVNIILPASIVGEIPDFFVAPKLPIDFLIPVRNFPSTIDVRAPLIGLERGLIQVEHEPGRDDIRIFGTVADRNFTISEGTLDVMVSNSGGDHERSKTFPFVELSPVLLGYSQLQNEFFDLQTYSGQHFLIERGDGESLPDTNTYDGIDYRICSNATYVYFLKSDGDLLRIPKSSIGSVNPQGSSLDTNLNVQGADHLFGVDIDNSNFFSGLTFRNNNTIVVLGTTGGNIQRTFDLNGIGVSKAIALDGNSVVVGHADATTIYLDWFNKNSGNNVTANRTKRVSFSIFGDFREGMSDMTIIGNLIYMVFAFPNSDRMIIGAIDKNLPNNTVLSNTEIQDAFLESNPAQHPGGGAIESVFAEVGDFGIAPL